ncbi:uncharacterized protein LOC128962260 [Oppia nitens]|uniref:uncharacterized protein LOC128962260 n=1 Tax=Oppia nitens TaxID=1686743 RepID=UPI0023DB6A0A|nr:uncharacterized protein LOC128962260 [Oppia nitens]
MKIKSIVSCFSDSLRTNVVTIYLIFMIISSFETLIESVRITPHDKLKAIWNTQHLFVNCNKDSKLRDGVINWYSLSNNESITDNSKAPVYQQHSRDSVKLFLVNPSKRYSGVYECRHTKDKKTISSEKFELKIYNSINIDGNKDSYVGVEGDNYKMTCSAKFDPETDPTTEAQVSWLHNNVPIGENEKQITVRSETKQSVEVKIIRSFLNIKNLNKDQEGIYTCEGQYANSYLTDVKNIDINLRVQFRPRFPENIQKYVWISDDDQQNSPVFVNVTCLVNADPIAQFQWYTGHGLSIENSNIKHKITNAENMSVLGIEYENIDKIKNRFNDPNNNMIRKFQCKANNTIGEARHLFELSVGKLPIQPMLANYSYDNGKLILTVNNTNIEPKIDIYKLEISDKQHIYFNDSFKSQSGDNTYEIDVEIPSGEHTMKISAHNPVGWSTQADPFPPQYLVVSSAIAVYQYMAFVLISSTLALVNAF